MSLDCRLDYNRIIIELDTVEQCDAVISTNVPELMSIAQSKKDNYVKQESNYSIYKEYWNNFILTSVDLSTMEESIYFKWTLVKQEIVMWISIGKMVDMTELNWMSERRGFDEQQKTCLMDMLVLCDLFGEKEPEIECQCRGDIKCSEDISD
jgi:hypothetical protein